MGKNWILKFFTLFLSLILIIAVFDFNAFTSIHAEGNDTNNVSENSDDSSNSNSNNNSYISMKLTYADGTSGVSREVENVEIQNEFMGLIDIEPHYYSEDIDEAKFELYIPTTYVSKDSLKLVKTGSSSTTNVTINDIKEDSENNSYIYEIIVTDFDKTSHVNLKFSGNFKQYITPADYILEVDGKVISPNPQSSAIDSLLHFKPKYQDYSITKYISQGETQSSNENINIRVGLSESDTGKVVQDGSLITYSFSINNVNKERRRDISSVTLTDTLPAGMKLAEGHNEGWTTSEDSEVITVKKTFTAETTDELLQLIANERLVLDAGGIPLTENKEFNFFTANVKNTVSFEAIPLNKSEGENIFIGEDSIASILTTRDSSQGSIAKYAYPKEIYDTKLDRNGEIKWIVFASNSTTIPLQNVVIEDHKILNTEGERWSGIDDRLKFVRFEIINKESKYFNGKTNPDVLEKVILYYSDNTSEDITLVFDNEKNFKYTVASDKTCIGYDVIFKNTYEMQLGEEFRVNAYSSYIDGDNFAYDNSNPDNNRYWNYVRISNSYQEDNKTIFNYAMNNAYYDLLPLIETMQITKETIDNTPIKNSERGNKFYYNFQLKGVLLDDLKYEDLRIIDLLPKELEFDHVNSNGGILSQTPTEIIENYKGTGRTALIFNIDKATLESKWNSHVYKTAYFSIMVKIKDDADYGIARNEVFVVSNDMKYEPENGYVDIYDFDNDGRTDDKLVYAYDDAYITGGSNIFAYQEIAHANQNDWNKDGFTGEYNEAFDYLLKVVNTAQNKTNTVVYDVLPVIGDKNIFQANRNSEFSVKLINPIKINLPGYTAFYTTSKDVYNNDMSTMVVADIWTSDISSINLEDVTAIKVVANEGTILAANTNLEVTLPVKLPSEFTDEEASKLGSKFTTIDEVEYITAYNNFGYKVDELDTPKLSNTVYLKITDSQNAEVNKVWLGEADDSVTFKLYQNGKDTDFTLSLKKENFGNVKVWNGAFVQENHNLELPRFDKDGKEYIYTIVEEENANYSSMIVKKKNILNNVLSYSVANTELINVSVEKKWIGQGLESVTVELIADGMDTGKEVTLSGGNSWKDAFTNLPKYQQNMIDDNGEIDESASLTEIKYTVKEKAIDGYKNETSGNMSDGYVITNTNIETVTVEVEKKWNGNNTDFITIRLFADNVEVNNKKVDASTGWKVSFDNLAKYHSIDGHEIQYTIKEDKLDGYNTEVVKNSAYSYTIINTEIVRPTPVPSPTINPSPTPSVSPEPSVSPTPQSTTPSNYSVATPTPALENVPVVPIVEYVEGDEEYCVANPDGCFYDPIIGKIRRVVSPNTSDNIKLHIYIIELLISVLVMIGVITVRRKYQ